MQLDSVLGESIQFVFKRAGSKTRFGGKKKKLSHQSLKKKKKICAHCLWISPPPVCNMCELSFVGHAAIYR